jgi:hypothetical protein
VKIWFLLSAVVLVCVHGYKLYEFPGLHFDEAWAANFSARIATENGFWPREGMSPYTSAWTHYIAAIFFKLFGIKLMVYRWSQLILSLSGLALFWLALKKRYGDAPAWLFPTAVLCLPGLVLNHRFGIEINSFHVLIFGWLMYALVNGFRWQAALAILYGVTSHILFFAVAGALVAYFLFSKKSLTYRDRLWVAATAVLLTPFFSQLLQRIPETGKVLLLLAATCSVAGIFATPIHFWLQAECMRVRSLFAKLGKPGGWVFFAIFAVLWIPLAVFAEGHWTVLLYKGSFQPVPLFGIGFLVLFPAIYFGWREVWRRGDGLFLCLLLLFIGIIIPKATTRYFELPMLCLAAVVAIGWTHLKSLQRVTIMISLCIGVLLFSRQLLPGQTTETKFHFLFLKDESGDFLSKQVVAKELGLRGCKISDIRVADFRGGEGLRFLARGDWQKADVPCPWPQAFLRRETQPVHAPERLLATSGYIVER